MTTLNQLWREFLNDHKIMVDIIKRQKYDELCAFRASRKNYQLDLQEAVIEMQAAQQSLNIYLGGVPIEHEQFTSINNLEQLQLFVKEVSMPHRITIGIDSLSKDVAYECASWLILYCIEQQLKFPDYVINSGRSNDDKQLENLIVNFTKHYQIHCA